MLRKLLIFTIVAHLWDSLHSEIIVQTPLGKIRGIIQKSRKGNDYLSFRGVKYAEPPIGQNRFRESVPIKPWEGEMDATKDGFTCPQENLAENLISEDCLILNIYTKSLSELLPVMFFIHGGFYAIGGSHSELYWNPRYLMDKDIVLVTINFRVGALGLLYTDSEDAPGNLGLKDQVIAMHWVRNNIKNFGGDPNQITLWGHSSGSMMATLHMVSPMSQGLFHRVIAMSGSSTSHISPRNFNSTQNLAKIFQCPLDNTKLLVECLRNVPYEKIAEISSDFLDWSYVVEKDFGQNIFMPEHPSILFAEGKFPKIPILAGMTKDEFEPDGFVQYYETNNIQELNEDFYKKAPYMLGYDLTLTSVSDNLRRFYLKNKPITTRNLAAYGQLYSDANIVFGIHRFLNLVRQHTNVFFYRQDFQGRYSWFYDVSGEPYGIFHADDLLYLYIHKDKGPMFLESDQENLMVETLTTLWTTFAQTGDPNNRTNPWTARIRWIPSDRIRVKVLYLNKRSRLGGWPSRIQRRMKFWDRLFPIPN